MRTKLLAVCPRAFLVVVLLVTIHSPLSALLGQSTAFTYQGRLNSAADPASGNYDLTFSIWTNSTGPAQIGGTLTNTAAAVSNGLFTVTLDFGAGIFSRPDP